MIKPIKIFTLLLVIISVYGGAVIFAHAQQGGVAGGDAGGCPSRVCVTNYLGVSDISGLINKIIDFLIIVAAPIVAGMILIGAYQMLFSAGDPEKFKVGRRTIVYAVVGYTIILLSKGIAMIIKNFFAH
jgi:hypothetical protein